MKTPDKLVQRVINKMYLRANQGMIKFGNTMEDTKKTKKEWLIEAQQEALDMAVYLEKCIQDEDETIVSWEGEDVKVKELEDSYGGTI